MYVVVNVNTLRVLLLCGCLQLLSACVALTTPQGAKPAGADHVATLRDEQPGAGDVQGWWRVGFHRPYTADDDVMWHLDALLANEVFKPLIAEHHQAIALWRFHRRASDDSSGHKFSFIFYGSRHTAAVIFQAIDQDELVKTLLATQTIERLSFSDLDDEPDSAIEATSDDVWQIELQRAWPHFIMGVSRTWLELVAQFAERAKTDGVEAPQQDIGEQIAFYEKVHNRVNSVWEQQGGHAFLHHLNALFGYQELYIIERSKTRF
ncbi:MAG: hypothetical protein PVF34_07815 [Gammaproteobacteria bacterium]|jgi:hypothetical protein